METVSPRSYRGAASASRKAPLNAATRPEQLSGHAGSSAASPCQATVNAAFGECSGQWLPGQRDVFFFASPKTRILARGSPLALSDASASAQPDVVASALAEGGFTALAGALRFDGGRPALLGITADRSGQPPHPAQQHASNARQGPDEQIRLLAIPPAGDFEASVQQALQRMRESTLRKVVLSRLLDARVPGGVHVPQLLTNLHAANPGGTTFCVPVPSRLQAGKQACLVGNSPELLVSRCGHDVRTVPLAGSIPRCGDPQEDHSRGLALLASDKDRREHAIVVESVVETLRPWCVALDVPPEPSLEKTSTMWHLGTRITARLGSAQPTALQLALELHPTPAVCGTPRQTALDTLTELEPFDRRYFAGAVGWCDTRGDGEWVVSIRCAEVEGDWVRLFAGAGVVPGSNPSSERIETSAKLQTMMNAMNVPFTDNAQ